MANEIEDAYCEGKKLTDVANMLRQLQAKNEALKKSQPLSQKAIIQIWAEHINVVGTYELKNIALAFARAIEKAHGIL